MEKSVNSQPQTAPSPKFIVELREYCTDQVLVRRVNVDFSVVTAFFAVMTHDQYVTISYHDSEV